MAIKVSESLAATGSTGELVLKGGFVSVQGTWAGTINVEVDPTGAGSWSNITDTAGTALAFTGNFNLAIDNGAPVKTRVKFTRTSGTAVVALIGE
ncbi:hypothetical protein [Mesorhizobium temperatum]|uniref:Uncharacterized protein n=1 Tax=Mesorhizobium temperatum TaxID=241416 RepID=A0A271LP41_9HYPH|nr:hypothetical protein [Mesorhizobium temperatum]PAQ09557.1 hypothetical protein CIT26_13620 [Mesorhizobium temperatum]